MTGSATFPAPDTEDEDLGEDLGGLDDLLASLRSEEQPAPKRGRGRAKKEAPAKDFKAVLWASADKLRAQMDAAEYKHLVLGLIFLKYISDQTPLPPSKARQKVAPLDCQQKSATCAPIHLKIPNWGRFRVGGLFLDWEKN